VKMPDYEIFIDNKIRKIELTKTGEKCFAVKINGKPLNVMLKENKLDFEKGFSIIIGEKTYRVELPRIEPEKSFPVKVEEVTFKVEVKTVEKKFAPATFETVAIAPVKKTPAIKQVEEGAVTAPMTGKILSIKVKEGEQVKAGKVLCILEAMKMENEIVAPKAGTVREIYVSEGSAVSEGETLFIIN